MAEFLLYTKPWVYAMGSMWGSMAWTGSILMTVNQDATGPKRKDPGCVLGTTWSRHHGKGLHHRSHRGESSHPGDEEGPPGGRIGVHRARDLV